MNGSISASTSYSNTSSTPAISSSADAAVDTPALDPRLHGLTMTGQPKRRPRREPAASVSQR